MQKGASRLVYVLVIDDAQATSDRIRSLLTEIESVVPVQCRSEHAVAVRTFMAVLPHCVVIDLPAHDRSGFDLLATLKRLNAQCQCIVLTNHASPEFRRESLEAGANHFLVKSTEFERVADIVRTLSEEAPC